MKKDAGLRGRMNPEDVAKLGEYLTEWCLRNERRAKIFREDIGDEITNESKHPHSPRIGVEDPKVIVDEQEKTKPRSSSPVDTESPPLSQGELPPSSSFCPSEVWVHHSSPALFRLHELVFLGRSSADKRFSSVTSSGKTGYPGYR